MEKYDLIIVGAGPAGIFTAVELLRHGSKKKILLVEKGKPVEKRHCPKAELGHCVNCRPTCAITTGFSGAGAFSDGKLSLSYEVGGDLPSLIGEEFAQELIHYTDKIYLEFGADPHVEGIYTGEDIKEIRKNAIHAGLKLVDCPIRHLGTEKAQQLYLAIQNYLADNGVEMLFSTECENIILENEECKGVFIKGPKDEEAHAVYADTVVIGTGRRGADWLEKICAEHHIAHKPGTVDIGVRVECRNEVMEKVNKVLYESKLIGYPKPWKNKVRTFCQNPGGFVAQENYDNDLAVVNGHSFKEKKSENTNLAILVSHNFTEPFNQPIAYAQKVGELTNMLGAGHILVQRYGDILDGKRTWPKELAQSNVKPTLKDAVAGDITAAMPYRAMTNIIEFIKMLDQKLCFIGDGCSMANSLIVGGLLAGMRVTCVCPEGYRPAADVLMFAHKYGEKFHLLTDPAEGVKDADVVVTAAWNTAPGTPESERRLRDFAGFQVTSRLMEGAKPDAMLLHCLPAHRGEEISTAVFEEHADEIFDEAENRLHVQKAVLAILLAGL